MWGNEASILFGDYLFAKAYTLAAKLHNRDANMILARTVEEMCVGELWQISTKFNFDMDEEQYFKVIYHKTGSLFATACRLGSVDSGAPAAQVDALANYGACFGTAFQIIDDCLDITGDEREMGKSLGTDLEKGKLTLPVIKLLRDLQVGDRKALQDLLASRNGASATSSRTATAARPTSSRTRRPASASCPTPCTSMLSSAWRTSSWIAGYSPVSLLLPDSCFRIRYAVILSGR